MRARAFVAVALLSLVARAGAAPPAPDSERERALARAQRDWAHAVGTLGYVYGAPLLELAIAEYRQTQGIARDMTAKRGLFAHALDGTRATPDFSWLPFPDPDVLLSSAWVDVSQQPYVLWIPPLEGHWYSITFEDAFANVVAVLSSRTIGTVGGWYLLAPPDWQGERPPGVMDEVRVPAPVAWILVRIAASAKQEAAFHARYQAALKLLPLDVYARSPKAAELASAQAQGEGAPVPRAGPELRGTLDAFRVINQKLRQLAPKPEEAALLALFDRAGFGPQAEFDPAKLPAPVVAGLRSAAQEAERTIRETGAAAPRGRNGWLFAPAALGAFGDDYLLRAGAAAAGLGASPPNEVATASVSVDRNGHALDGHDDYVIHFAADALPPAKAFWTVSAYSADSHQLLELRKLPHSIGGSSEGLVTGENGAIDIFLSSDPPEDPARRANWLPVRIGRFVLVARMYEPLPAALDGSYALPPVVPADD